MAGFQLTTDHLPLTTYHLPLTTYHLPLTTYHLPLTTYHLPLTTYHLPLTTAFEDCSRNLGCPPRGELPCSGPCGGRGGGGAGGRESRCLRPRRRGLCPCSGTSWRAVARRRRCGGGCGGAPGAGFAECSAACHVWHGARGCGRHDPASADTGDLDGGA